MVKVRHQKRFFCRQYREDETCASPLQLRQPKFSPPCMPRHGNPAPITVTGPKSRLHTPSLSDAHSHSCQSSFGVASGSSVLSAVPSPFSLTILSVERGTLISVLLRVRRTSVYPHRPVLLKPNTQLGSELATSAKKGACDSLADMNQFESISHLPIAPMMV